MADHNELGKKGEEQACAFLEENGYTILEKNWHASYLEVDIIALKDNILVFAEVKTRTSSFFGEPEAFVTKQKQKNLLAVADKYVRLHHRNEEIRFDILSVLVRNNQCHVNHIPDAFKSSWR